MIFLTLISEKFNYFALAFALFQNILELIYFGKTHCSWIMSLCILTIFLSIYYFLTFLCCFCFVSF